jgi:hypothetical protein
MIMLELDITEKRPRINIFKLSDGYYFKHFFDDPELFRELEPYYEKESYRFKMATAGERNKVMKLLEKESFDPTIIEDHAPVSEIWRAFKKLYRELSSAGYGLLPLIFSSQY